jgi:hypothetical protein
MVEGGCIQVVAVDCSVWVFIIEAKSVFTSVHVLSLVCSGIVPASVLTSAAGVYC